MSPDKELVSCIRREISETLYDRTCLFVVRVQRGLEALVTAGRVYLQATQALELENRSVLQDRRQGEFDLEDPLQAH